ncbi:MAG: c-type cytochrome domain-containing protein [Bryobacteraceae bacterium]
MRVLLLLIPALVAAAEAPPWSTEIRPLIEKRCGGCHGGEAKMGEYSVNTYATVMAGGNNGRAIVAGKPDESLFYQMVVGKAYPRMPMDGSILSDGETLQLRRWIESGAQGPKPGATVAAKPAQPKPAPTVAAARGQKPPFLAAAWSPKRDLVALAGESSVELASLSGSERKSLEMGSPARAVAFNHDGGLLAVGGGECAKGGAVRIFDTATHELKITIQGHTDCVYGLAFSPDGTMLATSSYDKLIKLWNPATGAAIRTLKDHIDAVYAVEFTRDGKRLISGGADRSVKIWDVASGQRSYTLSEAADAVTTLAVDPTGHYVAAGGADQSIRIWRLGENSGEMTQSLMAHRDAILRIVWSPDGSTLVTTSADRTLKVFRAADLTELAPPLPQSDWAYGLAFSPDGDWLAVARMDGTSEIIDLAKLRNQKGTAQ